MTDLTTHALTTMPLELVHQYQNKLLMAYSIVRVLLKKVRYSTFKTFFSLLKKAVLIAFCL